MSSVPFIQTGAYRHNKTGNAYQVIGVALQTENNDTLVIYHPVGQGQSKLYARPYKMFTDSVELNGKIKPRFEKIND